MLEQIWNKKIVTIIEMSPQDITDEDKPLPLVTEFSWNAYIGFYHELIMDYFQMYAPFPNNKQEFHLVIKDHNEILEQSGIVYHLLEKYKVKVDEPLCLECRFRTRKEIPQIDLRRHFKNNLKASTAIRYGKHGASILMVEMSINNVQSMLNSFRNMDYGKFLGSNNFQSDDLGYSFLIHRAEKIAVKFIYEQLVVERSCEKELTLAQLIQNTFGSELSTKFSFRLHRVPFKNLNVKMSVLQKYCHPDGYLYIHI